MTGGGDWDDMATPQWPTDGELPPPGDAAFDALLDAAPLPDGTAAPLQQLAAAFGELYAAPVDNAAAAEQYARAVFRAAAGQPDHASPAPSRPAGAWPAPPPPAPPQHRPPRRRAWRPRLSARIAAIGAAAVVTLGGAAAAAAYTGALPDMLHRLTPHHPATPVATPGSPAQPTTGSRPADPGTGRGLCVAYQDALAGSSPSAQRRALRKLAAVAGGTGNVTSYCTGLGEPVPAAGGQHGHPTHPAHPTHPVHLTHPSHPTHPTHPPHPSHSPK